MTTFGIVLLLFVVFCSILHEEFQHWLAVWSRWYRRRYRPTKWTTLERRKVALLVNRVK